MKFKKEKKSNPRISGRTYTIPSPLIISLHLIKHWKKNFFGGNHLEEKMKTFFLGEKWVFFEKKNEKFFLEKLREKNFFRFFQYYAHIFWLKSNFSDKITILSYKTIFGPSFSLISEIWWSSFFLNSKKLWIWAKMAIFWHVWPKSAKMRIFNKNQAN